MSSVDDENSSDEQVEVNLRLLIDRLPFDQDDSNARQHWEELPSILIERIYRLLNRKDQSRMSLVCRSWAKEYESPSIWKHFRFNVPDRGPEIRLARKFGKNFQHVEIACYPLRESLQGSSSWQKLQEFLGSCSSQLTTFRLTHFGSYFRFLDSQDYANAFRCVVKFLLNQHQLERVEFWHGGFRFQEGFEVLSALSDGCPDTLKRLVTREFLIEEVVSRERLNEASSTLPSLLGRKLVNLTHLETDYNLLFDNMFPRQPSIEQKFLQHGISSSLCKIVLHCRGSQRSRFFGITKTVWEQLKQASPELTVEVYLVPSFQPRHDLEFYVVPDMPLSHLDYRLDRLAATADVTIEFLLNYLTTIRASRSLRSLYLVWMRSIPNLSEVLLPFLQSCAELSCLQLLLMHPTQGVEVMLRTWTEEHRPPCLREVSITIVQVRNQDSYLNLLALADEYVPLLQVMGLNVFVLLESGW